MALTLLLQNLKINLFKEGDLVVFVLPLLRDDFGIGVVYDYWE
jgi:hypothetical protein